MRAHNGNVIVTLLSKVFLILILTGFALAFQPAYALDRIHIPGDFGVNQLGAATYEVPIAVPPGTAGMEPQLSLKYNSHRGDGLVGVGWSLSGISAITRCPKTRAQDGEPGSVSRSLNDRYCLDGHRLILTSGSYGAPNSEYRTEAESFSKITAKGSTTTGPAWFEVQTKNGRVMEFGNTSDSQIQDQFNEHVLVWAQNRVTDVSGNYYSIKYAEDSGEYWPLWIDYTGNVNTGLAPYNRVSFYYFSPRALGEIKLPSPYGTSEMDVLLGLIRTTNTSSTVKDYWLNFQVGLPGGGDLATERVRLAKITECVGGNSSSCIEPTEFEWQEPTLGPENISASGGYGVGAGGWRLADLPHLH